MMMTIKKGIRSVKILWCVYVLALINLSLFLSSRYGCVSRASRILTKNHTHTYTLSAHYAQKREWRSFFFLTFYIVVGFSVSFSVHTLAVIRKCKWSVYKISFGSVLWVDNFNCTKIKLNFRFHIGSLIFYLFLFFVFFYFFALKTDTKIQRRKRT